MIMEYTTDQQYTSEKCPILSFKAYLCCFKVKEILQGGRQEERREKQRERQWIFHLLVHCLKDCNAGSGPAWSRKLHCHFLVRGPSSWALILFEQNSCYCSCLSHHYSKSQWPTLAIFPRENKPQTRMIQSNIVLFFLVSANPNSFHSVFRPLKPS